MDILFILILGVAFYWLMLETQWLTIRLGRHVDLIAEKAGKMDIGAILMMGIGMVFLAVGFIMFPLRHKPFPAILISPSGKEYYMFNANQAKHICLKLPEWKWELANVALITPNGLHLITNMNGIQAERICRKHELWTWDTP